jgi:hypothetical protein
MSDFLYSVDTALAEVPVNILQLIDDTDFKTIEEAIAWNQAGMDLNWNFTDKDGNTTQTNVVPTTGGDYDWAHQGNGMYTIEMPASGGASANNDSEGFGWFSGVCDGVLPWRGPVIQFSPANVVDSLVDGTDKLEVDATLIEGSDATDQIRDAVVDDATRIDASALNTLSGFAPASTIAAQTDVTGLNDPTAVAIRQEMDANSTELAALTGRLTAARAGYLDNLNVGGNVASSAEIAALNDLSQAEAEAACDAALVSYDGVVPADLPANFADLSVAIGTGRVDAGLIEGLDATDQIRDAVVDDATRIDASALNTLSGFAPASTIAAQTDVTGLNDPTAVQIRQEMDANSTELGALTTRLSAVRAGYLDNLNVGGNVASSAEIAALNDPTAVAIRQEMDANSTEFATLVARLSAARAGYLDNLNVGGNVASSAEIAALNDPTPAEVADGILARSIAGSADGGRTVSDGLRSLRNRVAVAAGVMTVYEEDDATPAWTAAVTTAAGNPISEVDPT